MVFDPMQNLKAIWEGCASLSHLWGSSLKPHALFMKDLLQPNAVTFVSRTLSTRSQSSMWDQLRTVPWIASTVAPAELALRFWRDHQNLLIWAPIPLFVRLADYRCLEPALIQEWLTSTELPFHLPIFQPFPIQIVTMANYPCVGFLEQAVIAEGFLSNKVFPTKKEYTAVMIRALHQWTTKWTSFHPKQDILALTAETWTQHCQSLSTHITKSTISALGTSFEGAVFHCEDKQASSLRFSARASTTSPWGTPP